MSRSQEHKPPSTSTTRPNHLCALSAFLICGNDQSQLTPSDWVDPSVHKDPFINARQTTTKSGEEKNSISKAMDMCLNDNEPSRVIKDLVSEVKRYLGIDNDKVKSHQECYYLAVIAAWGTAKEVLLKEKEACDFSGEDPLTNEQKRSLGNLSPVGVPFDLRMAVHRDVCVFIKDKKRVAIFRLWKDDEGSSWTKHSPISHGWRPIDEYRSTPSNQQVVQVVQVSGSSDSSVRVGPLEPPKFKWAIAIIAIIAIIVIILALVLGFLYHRHITKKQVASKNSEAPTSFEAAEQEESSPSPADSILLATEIEA